MGSWSPSEATPRSDGLPDTAIVPYVEALNEAGIETYQSCSGHRHDELRTDGHLWFNSGEMDSSGARRLADSPDIHTVCRRYARSDCWEVGFPGISASEAALERAMDDLFEVLGVTVDG